MATYDDLLAAGLTPDQIQDTRANMLINAGGAILGGSGSLAQRLGQGVQAAQSGYQDDLNNAMKRRMTKAQLDNYQAEADARKAKALQEQQQAAARARLGLAIGGMQDQGAVPAQSAPNAGPPSLPQPVAPQGPGMGAGMPSGQPPSGPPPGPPPGAALGGGMGPPPGQSGAMPAIAPALSGASDDRSAAIAPALTAPQTQARSTTSRWTPQMTVEALNAGYTPEQIQVLAQSYNVGQAKVARTIEGRDAQGRPTTLQFDDYGNQVGQGVNQAYERKFQDLGNVVVPLDPYAQTQPLQKGQSPDSAASTGLGYAQLGEIRRHNSVTEANAAAATASGKAPAGYRFDQAGNLQYIPGGPADPDVAKRQAPTEFMAKSAGYGRRMEASGQTINDLSAKGVLPGQIKQGAEGVPLIGGALGAATNWTASADQQRMEQAQRDWVNANLRQESGASISQGEFSNARQQYFPILGDSPAVIAQKARNRAIAEDAMRNSAGVAWSREAAAANKRGSSSTETPTVSRPPKSMVGPGGWSATLVQ